MYCVLAAGRPVVVLRRTRDRAGITASRRKEEGPTAASFGRWKTVPGKLLNKYFAAAAKSRHPPAEVNFVADARDKKST